MAESYQEDVAGQGRPVTELQGLATDAKMPQDLAAVETMHQT